MLSCHWALVQHGGKSSTLHLGGRGQVETKGICRGGDLSEKALASRILIRQCLALLWTSISLSLYWSLLFFWPNLPSHQDPIPPFSWNLVPTCPLHGSVPQACSRCYSSFGSVPIIFIRLHRRVCNTLFPSFYFIPGTSITLLQSDKDNRIKGDACHVWSPLLGHFTDSISNPHKHLLRQIMSPIYK